MMSDAKASGGVTGVRSATLLALLVCTQLLPLPSTVLEVETGVNHSGEVDLWNETPFPNVAVPEGFSFLSYIDYSDVGVLINNQSEVSKTIGYAFASARNISSDRVFLFTDEATPTAETITPDQFDTYFAEPLRQMIADRNLTTELNYLVTTKGIPLRLNGPGNGRAAFDSEIGLVNGAFNSTIHQNWWATHTYGPAGQQEMSEFSRSDEGFYLVTRLTGYTTETALGLIDKANNSFGMRGEAVLDLATNRNGSGYKWWNDMLYAANTSLNGTLGIPTHFNQDATFVTNRSDVMFYASWGSNDGSWNSNFLPNSGFDTADSAWNSGAKFWQYDNPPLATGEDMDWVRQTTVKRNGAAAMAGTLSTTCSISEASTTAGLLAEYFDNAGISFNRSQMPNLEGRTPDYWRAEANIDHPQTTGVWSGLDERFDDYWSVRHSGAITIPESGNWTFHLNSDDGSVLWLDGQEVVDNRGEHTLQERSGVMWLDAGLHHLRTEFFEHLGWAGLTLSWEGVNQTKQVIPASAFTRGTGLGGPTSGLVHEWRFEEGSGLSVSDSASTNNLTIFGSSNGSGWQQCLFGNCYFFDGIDDYAKVDVTDWAGNFSVSLWVNSGNSSQDRYSSVIAVNDVAGDSASFQIMASGASPGEWEVYNNISYPFGTIQQSTWTNLVVTYENNTLHQYMDGELVGSTVVPNGTIDSIELYKVGVNRAGSTYFEGLVDEIQFWNRTLSSSEVGQIADRAAHTCPAYSASGGAETAVKQTYDFSDDLKGHAWIVYGYAQASGWLNGDFRIEVDAFDDNGTLLTTNISSERALSDTWNSRTMRFRPAANATYFEVRMVSTLDNITANGTVYFDTMNLRAIRPHFTWEDGSIAETAVSTGGRTFTWGATYGQSLVADLLEDGVSGVKGYVYEPYLSAIGYPSTLLPYYAYGYNFAEVNYAANPMISWMGTVVGDPKMAPYADILHDVEVEAVRSDGRLSIGVNGSIDVIVKNQAPGLTDGFLEVRDRNGNGILANVSLTMPGGDENGSRKMVSVNLTPTRVGFNEYVVRYFARDWVNPERVVDNNLAILNLQVNEPPTAESLVCSTWTVNRGDTVGCTTTVTDDFAVVATRLAWRVNGSGDKWTFINSTSTDGLTWYSSLSVPTTIPLGTLDLLSEVRDEQGQVDLLQLDNAMAVSNAPHTWYGVHIEGVDDEGWNGITPLPHRAEKPVVRDRDIFLRSCVIDADHDPSDELPMIITDSGTVTQVEATESGFSDVFCYRAVWRLPWGGGKGDVNFFLYDSIGSLFTSRVVSVHDEPLRVDLTLTDIDGNERALAMGDGERVRMTLKDPDDLLLDYSYSVRVMWPGQAELELQGETDSASLNQTTLFVTLAPPPAGLEFGDLLVEVEMTSPSKPEEFHLTSASWGVHLIPPTVSGIGLCETTNSPFRRGVDERGWVAINHTRELAHVQFNLAQSGNIVAMTAQPVEWDDCRFPDGNLTYWGFTLNADNSFTAGPATLQTIVSDVDSLRGVNDTAVEISFSPPEVVDQTGEVTVGVLSELRAQISDADGHIGTICTFVIIDVNATRVMDAEGPLPIDGTFSAMWMPPAEGAPFASTIGCTDAEGQQAAHTRSGIIPEDGVLQDSNDDGSDIEVSDKGDGVGTILTLTIGAIALLVVIAILTLLVITLRPQREEGGVVEQVAVGWAAPQDSRLEGEQNLLLADMAMKDVSEVSSTTDDLAEVAATLYSEQSPESGESAHRHDEADGVGENLYVDPLAVSSRGSEYRGEGAVQQNNETTEEKDGEDSIPHEDESSAIEWLDDSSLSSVE